jgi:hypothetical protein
MSDAHDKEVDDTGTCTAAASTRSNIAETTASVDNDSGTNNEGSAAGYQLGDE